MTLIWHRSPDRTGKPQSPISVVAWIERGQQIRSTLIQPKLVWKRKHGGRDDEGISKISNEHMNEVDLLDISHILKLKRVNRDKFPLARSRHCFSLDCFAKSFVFEASCEAERDRIALCLKLAVARLGAMIIANDNTFFEEFFHSGEAEVPGAPPSFQDLNQ